MSMLPRVVFVLGGPGAGKGTQCQNIVREFKFEHLSAGDLLRAERSKPGSEYGELIERHIREGSIVPVEITCQLLERRMRDSRNTTGFLIDGFPRNQDNLLGWEARCAARVRLMFVLFLDCSLETCERRCLARGAAGSGRSDDNADSLRKRFATYENDTLPVVKHYEKMGKVRRIDADQSPEMVFRDVANVFNSYYASGDE